jgi:hypothetical protein
LQDDLKRFVSEPQPPPQGIEIPEGGKTKTKSRSGGKSAKAMTPSSWKTHPRRRTTMTRRHYRTASSCGRGSVVPACLMYPLCKIRRLAWRLV